MSDVSDVPRATSQTSVDLDLATWLTKPQAAEALGVSTKAVERFAQAGKLEQRTRAQAHGPKLVVYYPEDVARLAAERHGGPPKPFVVPASAGTSGNGTGTAANLHFPNATSALARPDVDPLRAFAAAVYAAVMSQTSQTSLAAQPTLYVTIPEASAITGLSQALLRRYIASGGLHAIKDRGWRIRRKDLEQL